MKDILINAIDKKGKEYLQIIKDVKNIQFGKRDFVLKEHIEEGFFQIYINLGEI